MPKIQQVSYSPIFSELQQQSKALGEEKDCAVKALAIICGQPYSEALNLMTEHGRKPMKGTYWPVIEKSLSALGYRLERISLQDIIASYPKPHCNVLKNVTTHHPRRFPGCFPAGSYLLDCGRHVSALIDGQIIDWSVNRSLRIKRILRIVKI